MRNPRVASRYAKALLDLALERSEIDVIKTDADFIIASIVASRDLRVFFSSPIIKPLIKEKLIGDLFSKDVSELMIRFLSLLTRHRREGNTKEVLVRFIALYLEEKNIIIASVTTPIEMDSELKAEFKTMLQGITKKEIQLKETVDTDIIGGFVVRIGDNELDASISGKLKRLQTEFKDNPYVAEY